jgi:hypothetical protein
VVLLFLAVVWAVVLGPTLLHKRSEQISGDSVGDFHRKLLALRRTGPNLVPPAHSLREVLPDGTLVDHEVIPLRETVASLRGESRDHFEGQELYGHRGYSYGGVGLASPTFLVEGEASFPRWQAGKVEGRVPVWPPQAVREFVGPARLAASRSRMIRRRRDTLLALVATVLGLLILGAVPQLQPLWWASAGVAVLVGVYVGLLVHFRNVEAERESKVAYLPRPATAGSQATARRSAAN